MKNYTTKLVGCYSYFVNQFEKGITLKNILKFSLLLSPLFTIAGNSTFKCTSPPLGLTESIRTTLYLLQPDNSTIMADGVYTEYNNLYHDSVTLEDAIKFTNILENIGLVRYGKTLAVERRPIIKANDTLFIKLWKTQKRNYQIELITNLSTNVGLEAFFVDSYLNTSTSIGLAATVKINFIVNADAASCATNRFKIIFKPFVAPLPLVFTLINAYRITEKIAVNFKVENETNRSKYEVERSLNGKDFLLVNPTLVNVANNTSGNYLWIDNNHITGNIFYRIKTVTSKGAIIYSDTVKVSSIQKNPSFMVYPNPLIGSTINLQIQNQQAGIYQVKLMNIFGQVVCTNKLTVSSDNMLLSFNTGKALLKGMYQLEIKNADNLTQVKTVMVQ